MHKFRLTSTYLGKKGFPSLYNYYFFSWRIFVTRIEIYILSEYYLENFAGNESRGNCIPSPAPLMQRRRTITKQPMEIRETPERETEVWSGGTTEEFSSSNPSEQSFFFLFFFFFAAKLPAFKVFIYDRYSSRGASPARCNRFRFETFELYLTSLTSAQSEFPTRTLFYIVPIRKNVKAW